jgi:hypothetical protein
MTSNAAFEVGQTYYGHLACAHGTFPVKVVKRTEKTVWFEHVDGYKAPAKAKIKDAAGGEGGQFHGWWVLACSKKDNGWNMLTA